MEGSSYNLEDEGSVSGDAEVEVDLTDASGENTSSRASSAAMSRPMTRGTIETRPQSSGSIAIDDGASEYGWGGGSNSSELSTSVKRLIGCAKDRSASSSSHNMDAIMQLYEQTKIATAEAQQNSTCIPPASCASCTRAHSLRLLLTSAPAVKVIPMYSEDLLCQQSTSKPRLNALQELFVYYAARQDISVTGKTSQPSFEDILKASAGAIADAIILMQCDAAS
jgi:hypothetical protein